MSSFLALCLCLLFVAIIRSTAGVVDFKELGGVPSDDSIDTMNKNGALLNATLNSLSPGDVFVLPNETFHTQGGIIVAQALHKITIVIDGTLSFNNDRDTYPRGPDGKVLECLLFHDLTEVVFTSSGGLNNRGTFNGNGQAWWGAVKYLEHQEDRPRLFHILQSKSILFEKIALLNSPFWTFYAENCDGLEVRYSEIDARWENPEYWRDRHTLLDLQAFNTDGFDVTGQYVHIHDVKIWNDDDCVCVKDNSQHMLFENIEASGLGLVVGSIGSSRVNNITFRNAVMNNTVKGIYMKTRWNDDGPIGEEASISNVLYENITIIKAEQFPIWIGPAQQSGQPCSLLWPEDSHAECLMSGYQSWNNITLKDVYIDSPWGSPGVFMSNNSNPIENLTLTNVVVTGAREGHGEYLCLGPIVGTVEGGSTPRPDCIL